MRETAKRLKGTHASHPISDYLEQIISLMIALHEADILHADFKPETIMLTGIDVPKMINHIEKLLKARDYCITEYESLDERVGRE